MSAFFAMFTSPDSVSALTEDGPVYANYECRGSLGYSSDFNGRKTFLWRPQWLEAIASDPEQRKARLAQAEEALHRGPYSVTDKGKNVPGASSNDYASIGPYWWPNPDQADGLPYIRRDGVVNPERNGPDFDKGRLSQLGADLEALALGYFLTEDARYATRAAMLVDIWFLDPDTRMSPNMDFAQGVPGRVNGRGEGIIEASDFSTVIESVGLILPSGALSSSQHANLQDWYAQFVSWLQTSENGKASRNKTNNHAIFYDFYLSHFALFAGNEELARNVSSDFLNKRLAQQMDQDGRFTSELNRTRSWHYSNYVLAGAGRLATIAECVDHNLWAEQLDDGRGLEKGIGFLGRYSGRLEEWPYPDRDHAAKNYDRMKHTHQQVEALFARDLGFVANTELP
ncbi:alginate lyase family protein [Altererythrobacter ishigakiensis]|nr:alginate lyase family protein [Altererythrobacter ishigakiensis]